MVGPACSHCFEFDFQPYFSARFLHCDTVYICTIASDSMGLSRVPRKLGVTRFVGLIFSCYSYVVHTGLKASDIDLLQNMYSLYFSNVITFCSMKMPFGAQCLHSLQNLSIK